MTPRPLASLLLAAVAAGALPAALACGEGVYLLGDGLRYQGYLAPRPAVVLVYDSAGALESPHSAVYRGLVQAGHRLTVVRDDGELAQALRARRYDVVIAEAGTIGDVAAAAPAPAPRLLPLVAASQQGAPGPRGSRGAQLRDDASLGQYLRQINRLMKG